MSELDVIVIHVRAEQAAEYERLFAERELPRRREHKERAPSSAPGRSSSRPGQPRSRGDGGQPLGLITERDERMKCLYVTVNTGSPNRNA